MKQKYFDTLLSNSKVKKNLYFNCKILIIDLKIKRQKAEAIFSRTISLLYIFCNNYIYIL